jgi:hypothetical protein
MEDTTKHTQNSERHVNAPTKKDKLTGRKNSKMTKRDPANAMQVFYRAHNKQLTDAM